MLLGDYPHGHPSAREMTLDLGHGVLAVMEDRGAQYGVGSRLDRVRQIVSSAPAPPDAITGTLTASATAAVSSRS